VKKSLLLIAFGVLSGLLGAGILFLASRPPRGNAIRLLPPPTESLWVVQLSGAVVQPGVYELPAGSRVQDAVRAAGGFTPDASTAAVNLAAPIKDGEYIIIPAIPPTPVAAIPIATSTPQPATRLENPPLTPDPLPATQVPPAATPAGLININTASLEDLDRLPGIGPVMAQRIIDYRTTNGPFAVIDDIMNVQGIGPATFEKIKSLITVGP
jgi:competence protein ComEA